ncbi:MAG: F0F1 ATP synthase subunit B' [Sulfurospirillum sp.]|nr:F0F1 ATP synthase subunit B' [Sulfurospirillum sp.]MBL0703863.1 F0F1 ATP synthase subunit B' [Sulfurospirillum sp.]
MLSISPVLLLVTGIVFFTLLIFLDEVLYRPLLEFIDKRNNSIERDLKNANENTSDIEVYHKEVDQIMSNAKIKAGKIREVALSDAKVISTKKIEKKRSELEEKYTLFLKELELDKIKFQNSLSANIPNFRDSIKQKLGHI